MEATAENVARLCRPDRATYFIYRDPRDLLVSQVFFATDLYEEHGMHAYYNSLPDFSARLSAAIAGVDQDGIKMVNVKQRYEGVLQWLRQNNVLCVRFEDLVNKREAALDAMLTHVERTGYAVKGSRAQALLTLSQAIQPRQSRTFRSGKTGGWRDHFTDENKELFKRVAGDLLIQLHYEDNNDW